MTSNYLIIGSMVRRKDFLGVGGFDEKYDALEDWHFWAKLILSGARVTVCPEAIYRVFVREQSRNNHKNHGEAYPRVKAAIEQYALWVDHGIAYKVHDDLSSHSV